jgi:hypothetical protein
MNKFTIVCTHSGGAFTRFTSENANLDLVKEVFKIIFGDLPNMIFEGHVEPVNQCDTRLLRSTVSNHLIFQESLAKKLIYSTNKERVDRNLNRLREYMKVTET